MVKKRHEMFVHSKCCGAHWELICEEGDWRLECENCGMPIGSGVTVTGPDMGDCSCEECGGK